MRNSVNIRKSNFLQFLVFLFIVCLVFHSSAKEEKIWHTDIKSDMFSALRDFENLKPNDDFKFFLRPGENEVDISDFVEILNQAKKSKYNNYVPIDVKTKTTVFNSHLPPLCQHAEEPLLCEQRSQIKIQRAINQLGRELAEDIRYPHNYYIMGQQSFSEVREILTLRCPDCRQIRLDKGSQSEFDALFPLIESQKHSCLKEIAKNMAKKSKYYKSLNSCQNNKTHPVCKSMLENNRLFMDRLFRLTELVYGEAARSQTEMQLCSDCSRFSEKESTEISKSLEEAWEQARNCEDIPPGKQKRVSSGTGLNKEYTVRREDDGSHFVVLNLQFTAAENYEGSVSKDQVPSHYRREVKKCLKRANKKMLGPEGEKIQVVLEEEPSGQSPCPEPAEIVEIGPSGIVSSPSKYASDIIKECPRIIHEILHQIGLCDEYLVKKRGYIVDSKTGETVKEVENIHAVGELDSNQSLVLQYDCRVTRTNSVMANHYERWINVFFKETEGSLVTSQQVSAILYGDCNSRNRLFNECSQLAYKNSFEDKTCLKKRKECEDLNALGNP